MIAWLNQHPLFGNRSFRAVGLFLGGFLFEIVTLERIDSVHTTLRQIVYLLLVYLLLRWEIREITGREVPSWLQKHWKYKDHAIQFLIGGLLSVYLLFFFMSASIASALAFLALMSGLLILNEFVHSLRFRVDLHLMLFSMCVTSFWIAIVPTLAGQIREFYFYASLLVASGFLALTFRRWIRMNSWHRSLPIFSAPVILLVFYFFQLIPPVPLAVKSIGVYRSISKSAGQYTLTKTTSPWFFWRSGDQVFDARPQDELVLFMRIFAPARFEDRLYVVWRLHTARGTETLDRIPLTVVGGREEGFRGYVVKSQYVPGNWVASLQTGDGREVTRLSITIREDLTVGEREFYTKTE